MSKLFETETDRALDRQILLVTVGLWAYEFLLLMSGSAISGWVLGEPGALPARVITTSSAAALTWGLHLLLKRAAPRRQVARFALAAGAAILGAAVITAIDLVAFWRLAQMKAAAIFAPGMVIGTYILVQWIFLAWAGLRTALVGAAELRERDRRLAMAESAAQQAKLAALRLQINPHFLFNALNTLSGLVSLGRNAAAERMILDLSAVLRRTLATAPDQLTPLAEELEVQLMYLRVEQTRFSDRLEVRCDADEAAKAALVPSLILQPLVENAIKHGLARSEGAMTIVICARRNGDRLELEVSNRGGGHDGTPGFGIGLRNVRERLQGLYGKDAEFSAGPDGDGWTNLISLPWTAGRAAAA
jgi:two-component system LytT family sensor kinase